jgi:hypothetical protein
MPRRKEYSGRDQIVAVDGIPLVDLSDADDAIVAELDEDEYGDPAIDLYGEGRHVRNNRQSGKVTVRIKETSIVDLKRLTALQQGNAPISAITHKDLSTNTAGFIGKDAKILRAPTLTRGKVGSDVEFVFNCIKLTITHDGPRVFPI